MEHLGPFLNFRHDELEPLLEGAGLELVLDEHVGAVGHDLDVGHAGIELEHLGPPRGGAPDWKPPPSLAAATLVATRSGDLAIFIIGSFWFCTSICNLLRLRHHPFPHLLGA